ncbi:DUF721 domain-containing protein [Janibacter anophelis]|uniref:DUF721 domain-containing protein n=1 Tax=Janibacter anophelis TaxID=319054 RepID=UPI000DEECC44|nr:DciA family protein [Janibacter anophelis]
MSEGGESGLEASAADGLAPRPAEGAADGDQTGQATEGSVEDAAAAALARARAAAAKKGLRPGMKPRRKRKWQPQGVLSSGGRDPQTIGDQVERLVGDRGWQVDVAAGSVMGRWPEIVGREVAEHCQPVTFEAGVLSVRADSTAWATQIRLLSSTLLGRISESVGPDVVHEIRVHGPSAPSWSRGPRRTSDGRGPRDTYG